MSLEDIQSSSCADSQEIQPSEVETKTEKLSDNTKDSTLEDNFTQEKAVEKVIESEQKIEPGEIQGSKTEQDLYNEVLEKLDIIKKEKIQDNQVVQEKFMQDKIKEVPDLNKIKNLEQAQAKIQVENAIAQDFDRIQKLMQLGLINSVQGQNLKKEVLKKAFDKLVQTEKIKRNLPPVLQNSGTENKERSPLMNRNEGFEEFSKSNPDFFTSDGRKEVLDYLKSGDVIFGKDELSKISNIIRTVEKAAIDRYLKKVSYEKTLRNSNEVAKQRLTANAQKSGFSDKNLSRTFTREQIGKMSSVEFAKYESIIMEQLKKGLIR